MRDIEPISVEELRIYFETWRAQAWDKVIPPVQEAIDEELGKRMNKHLHKPMTSEMFQLVNADLKRFMTDFDHPDIRITECEAGPGLEGQIQIKLAVETTSYPLGTLKKLHPIIQKDIKDGIAERFAQQKDTQMGNTERDRGAFQGMLRRRYPPGSSF